MLLARWSGVGKYFCCYSLEYPNRCYIAALHLFAFLCVFDCARTCSYIHKRHKTLLTRLRINSLAFALFGCVCERVRHTTDTYPFVYFWLNASIRYNFNPRSIFPLIFGGGFFFLDLLSYRYSVDVKAWKLEFDSFDSHFEFLHMAWSGTFSCF